MNKQHIAYSKYFWEMNEDALKETADILRDPGHSKFRIRMVKLLSRCQSPKEVFSVISKENFVKAWPQLRGYWARVDRTSDFREWWQAIYEEILKGQGKSKKPEGNPSALFKGIGTKIKEARIDKGMSQKDLALVTRMKQPDISRIEEGKKNLTLGTLARICKCLGIEEISMKI